MSDLVVAKNQVERIKKLIKTIQSGLVENVENIIALGQELLNVKGELDHGQFKDWIGDNFQFSYATARRWMSVAENQKEVRKRLKGNSLVQLSEAYSVKTSGLALSDPKADLKKSHGNATGKDIESYSEDWFQETNVLTYHRIMAKAGEVFVWPKQARVPTRIYKGSFYLDPIVGLECLHQEIKGEIDKGLEMLFTNYFATVEKFESKDQEVSVDPSQKNYKSAWDVE